jgi:hypothetical protein
MSSIISSNEFINTENKLCEDSLIHDLSNDMSNMSILNNSPNRSLCDFTSKDNDYLTKTRNY